MIQTSAAIDAGDSGGALADLHGQVIGSRPWPRRPRASSARRPASITIQRTLVQHRDEMHPLGHVVDSHHASSGVQIGDTNGLGVYVQSVTDGGPAAKAGLVPGDVIHSVNGHSTATINNLDERGLELFKTGNEVRAPPRHAARQAQDRASQAWRKLPAAR